MTEFEKYAIKDRNIGSNLLHQYSSVVSSTPYILEEREMRATQMDVFSRLMMDRIIYLGTPIDDQIANIIIAQLLFLDSYDSKKEVKMYINSPGGSVSAGLGIYDTMQLITPTVSTVCVGMAASMGAVLMGAGEKGTRAALKHSRIMIHQPMGGIPGGTQATDMEITLNEIIKLKNELYNILSYHTGQPFEKIEKDSERDYWMTSTEAKEYGMVDEVLTKKRD